MQFTDAAAFSAAYERILDVLGVRTQVELADKLKIRQSSVSDSRRRGSIPDAWLMRLFFEYRVNPAWVLTGEKPQYIFADSPSCRMDYDSMAAGRPALLQGGDAA